MEKPVMHSSKHVLALFFIFYFNIYYIYFYLIKGQAIEQNNVGTIDRSDYNEVPVPEINVEGSESSISSHECFSSPGYTPYDNYKVNLDFEISDPDDDNTLLPASSSSVNTNNSYNMVNTVAAQKLGLDVQRAKKCSFNYKKNVKDKRVYCIFCENLQTNFPRHVERKHALEPEVRSFILMPKKSKERIRHLEFFKNKGNFHYNKNILEKKKVRLLLVDDLHLRK